MKATKHRFSEIPRDYPALVAMFPPRPLRDAVDERNVEEIVKAMAGHDLTRDQEDYLDLLSDLLLKYTEARTTRRLRRQPVHERLRYLMEHSGTTAPELAALLGCSQPLVSLILSGRRALSKSNAVKLAAHFRLSVDYFLVP